MKKNEILAGVASIAILGAILVTPTYTSINLSQGQDYLKAQVVSETEPYYTFSHDGENMVANKDRWTFKLDNARRNNRLSVKAWKDGQAINGGKEIVICKVGWSRTSCQKTGTPAGRDVGFWEETVFINNDEVGRISFTVISDKAPIASPDPYFSAGPLRATAVSCGGDFTFRVDNHPSSQVWLHQTKNGAERHDGIISIPYTYRSVCNADEGTYVNTIYNISPTGRRGVRIGNATITIRPVADVSTPETRRNLILRGEIQQMLTEINLLRERILRLQSSIAEKEAEI